jgi:hypothetical protein
MQSRLCIELTCTANKRTEKKCHDKAKVKLAMPHGCLKESYKGDILSQASSTPLSHHHSQLKQSTPNTKPKPPVLKQLYQNVCPVSINPPSQH